MRPSGASCGWSASIMIVLICMFTGIRDIAALLGLFAAKTAMILFGLLMERQQTAGEADRSASWFGWLAGAVPWVAIFGYVAGAPRVPRFVWAIIITQLLLFAASAGIDPFGLIRHLGLTLTVAEPHRFAATVRNCAGLPASGNGDTAPA